MVLPGPSFHGIHKVELIHDAALEEIDQLPGEVLPIVRVHLMPFLPAHVVQHASEHFEVGRFHDLGVHLSALAVGRECYSLPASVPHDKTGRPMNLKPYRSAPHSHLTQVRKQPFTAPRNIHFDRKSS
ncbi:hypothetical protein MPLSOD_340157 [Mesorhizobium sp. SOD10]|nr:hypothetical protein MPLSOD_340157 [Mesorhizobium sp. SOD10]